MVARYYRELLNHLTRTIKDRDSAADIVQETYVRVLALQQSGQVVSQPRALLYHTARNLVIDRHRRNEVRGESVQMDDMPEEFDMLAASPACEPDVALASSQAVDAMLQTIDKLPVRCREAFILHRFDGLPHAEVAERMGISRKMVEQHIKLAMDACRRCKAKLDEPSQEPQARK